MAATYAGTASDEVMTRAAVADGVATNQLRTHSGVSIPAGWATDGQLVPWETMAQYIRLKPGAPDGRNPADPPPFPDPAMQWCPDRADLEVWRSIVVQPTDPVPGIVAVRGTQFSPPDVAAQWTAISDTEDDHYDDNVQVIWYVNGVQVDVETVPQANGSTAFRDFAFGNQVYVRVRYTNSAGVGPQTQSNTLFL